MIGHKNYGEVKKLLTPFAAENLQKIASTMPQDNYTTNNYRLFNTFSS